MAGSGATNAYVPITAPPATAPRVGLLASVERPAKPEDHWVNGIAFDPERPLSTDVWADCPEGEDPTPYTSKDRGEDPANVYYRPWTAVADDACSTFGFEARDWQGRARRLLAASLERKVGFELWTGTIATGMGFPNQFLTNSSDGVNLGTFPLVYALSELQQQMADLFDGRGMIHCTYRTLNLWASAYVIRREGLLWLDAFDNLVVASPGYDGSGPDNAPGSDVLEWAYGTPVVQFLEDKVQVIPDSFAEATDRDVNDVTFRAEQIVAAYWDGQPPLQVEVDLCNTCCDGS